MQKLPFFILYSKVYEVLLENGILVAMKKIDLSSFPKTNALEVYEEQRNEVNILKSLNHQNIVK